MFGVATGATKRRSHIHTTFCDCLIEKVQSCGLPFIKLTPGGPGGPSNPGSPFPPLSPLSPGTPGNPGSPLMPASP